MATRGGRVPFTRNQRRWLALKDRYRNRRVFIIGNGPSVQETDLSLLRNEITIGCNGIFLLFDRLGFLPTFYTVEDTLVAEDRAEVINGIRGTTKIFPYDLRYCLKANGDTIYINFLRQYPDFPQFSTNCEKLVFWGGTVTFMNMQIAYHIGSRQIYLIGVDHDYKAPAAADERKGSVITSRTTDINHFHPDYFGPGYRYHDPMVHRMETAYRQAKITFEAQGGKIWNATCGGKLEVFPRVDYYGLF
jgi:hypothetical protein